MDGNKKKQNNLLYTETTKTSYFMCLRYAWGYKAQENGGGRVGERKKRALE